MVDGEGLHVGLVVGQELGDARKEAGAVVALEDKACALVLVAEQVGEGLEDILLGDDADDVFVVIQDREDGDALVQHLLGGLLDEGVLVDGLDVGQHDVLDLGLAQQVVELVDGQGGRVGAALLCHKAPCDETDQLSGFVDDGKAVEVALGHDINCFGNLDVFGDGDRLLGHMIFYVHKYLLIYQPPR